MTDCEWIANYNYSKRMYIKPNGLKYIHEESDIDITNIITRFFGKNTVHKAIVTLSKDTSEKESWNPDAFKIFTLRYETEIKTESWETFKYFTFDENPITIYFTGGDIVKFIDGTMFKIK